jgi:2'-5' RNA ligase
MKRTRTFVALDPGEAVRDRLVALQEELAHTGADVKWVEADNLHLTLLFLGEVDQRALMDVCRAVGEQAQQFAPFPLSLAGAGAFPNLRRPRTLWVGVRTGAAQVCALHNALEAPLLELGCYRREERQFTPHLTLGRVKGERGSDDLARALTKHAAWVGGETVVDTVHVMGSELTPTGPVYTVLSRAKLQ